MVLGPEAVGDGARILTEGSRRAFIERGRFGKAEEAAALIAFLASGPVSYVTGTTIPVDGGAMRPAF